MFKLLFLEISDISQIAGISNKFPCLVVVLGYEASLVWYMSHWKQEPELYMHERWCGRSSGVVSW